MKSDVHVIWLDLQISVTVVHDKLKQTPKKHVLCTSILKKIEGSRSLTILQSS